MDDKSLETIFLNLFGRLAAQENKVGWTPLAYIKIMECAFRVLDGSIGDELWEPLMDCEPFTEKKKIWIEQQLRMFVGSQMRYAKCSRDALAKSLDDIHEWLETGADMYH
jgi:hypothetical protein